MKKLLILAALALGSTFAGCNCGGMPPGTDDGGGDGGGNNGDGMKLGDGGGGNVDMTGCANNCCGAIGVACTSNASCCSGFCAAGSLTCQLPPNMCAAQGQPCKMATDCCNLTCTNGTCGAACKTTGTACGVDGECCTQNCVNGMCQPINMGGCTTVGNKCAANGDCCSMNCQGGLCTLAGGGCNVLGDICQSGADCCSGICTIAMGKTAGTCSPSPGNCVKDGEVCPGCNQCCSRVCEKTNTGGSVCAPAGGCRLVNDLCHKDSDCCGGPQMAQTMCSVGTVKCQIIQGSNPPVGTCTEPGPGTGGCGTCDPEGNVCGIKPVQACSGNYREDCCDCLPPKFNCCKFDSHGVARCFGGSTNMCPTGYTGVAPCCIKAGDTCTFSDECCNKLPCVPDNQGVLRCGSMCEQQGQVCTADSDCCIGLLCIIPKGQLTGTCGNPNNLGDGGVPPPPTDGGMVPNPDMALCPQLGQKCTTTTPCCNQLNCTPPGGVGNCAVGEMDCTCTGIIG